jgi:hypothetical protein
VVREVGRARAFKARVGCLTFPHPFIGCQLPTYSLGVWRPRSRHRRRARKLARRFRSLSLPRALTIPLSPPAQASIVGRRIGRLTWSTSSGKTLEGSAAFWASVVVSGGFLWAVGAVGQVDVRETPILLCFPRRAGLM